MQLSQVFPDLAGVRRSGGELKVGFILLLGLSVIACGFEGNATL
jgi:hypothetical protein